ncbi:MAG: anthranilate phosphoribosyltransferase [Verrucomicrobiales bacterium]
MQELSASLREGNELGRQEVDAAAQALLSDHCDEEAKADFLRALADKGESAREVAYFVEAFLDRAVAPGIQGGGDGEPLLDVCGTGGDQLDLFNVSTASVFILAGGGVKVVKHGNRGITSKSGGADVLEALGIAIELPPGDLVRSVREVGAGFLFAPLYHPAFKSVAPVRAILAREGRRSIFNILGPLLNPARPDCQLIGVFRRELVPMFGEILAALGRRRAWVAHGTTAEGGAMDEISTLGPTTVVRTEGAVVGPQEELDLAGISLAPASLADLVGGDAKTNAAILEAVLDGSERGPRREIVVLNAAAGLVVAGRAEAIAEGVAMADEIIDRGDARRVLEGMRNFS